MRWQFGKQVASLNYTSGNIATLLGAEIDGPEDIVVNGLSTIQNASKGDLTFMVNSKYAKLWNQSAASVGIISRAMKIDGHDSTSRALLKVDNVDLAMAKLLEQYKCEDDLPEPGIHRTASIHPSAAIGKGVRIGPAVVVCSGAVIHDGVALVSHNRIGRGSTVGARSILRAGAVLSHSCSIGEDSILHTNVSIGTDGFGYCPNSDMSDLVKFQHVGSVVIGDRVEIGSNTCIDRGKFAKTLIGDGTKLDNLVQIGHNVEIGQNCVIAAKSGLGGSVKVGNWVQIGAFVGIAPHCNIGDGAKIGAKSGVMHDIPPGEEWLGYPAGKLKEVLRQWASTRKLPTILAEYAKVIDH